MPEPSRKLRSFYPAWSRLRAADMDGIRRAWTSLLAKPAVREESIHAFLTKHAQLAFWDELGFATVISKVRLGADLVTDFVAVYDNWSNGIRYKLIEIERPSTAPFTKEGIPSSGLSRALQQVLSWRQWLEEHASEARRLFPSYFHHFDSRPVFIYEIIVGNRENSEKWLDRRRILSNRWVSASVPFESFTPRLTRDFTFQDFSEIGDEQLHYDLESRNRLACPFTRALTDPNWREMLREGRRGSAHFMHTYGMYLLKYRRENEYAERFRRLLRKRETPTDRGLPVSTT